MSNVAIVETAGTSRALGLPLGTLLGVDEAVRTRCCARPGRKVSLPSVRRELKSLVFGLVILVVVFEELRSHASTEHPMAARYSFQYKLNLPLEIRI